MSESPETVAPESPGLSTAFDSEITRLTRVHNLLIFVVFLAGLVAVGVAYDRHERGRPIVIEDSSRTGLLVLRIALPIMALVLTAMYTSWQMKRQSRRMAAGDVPPAALLSAFQKCKAMSMMLLGIAAVVASVCLALGHRWIDLIVAAIPFLLLIVTRPSTPGMLQFMRVIELEAEEIAGAGKRNEADGDAAQPSD
jgi:hypothetical protein